MTFLMNEWILIQRYELDFQKKALYFVGGQRYHCHNLKQHEIIDFIYKSKKCMIFLCERDVSKLFLNYILIWVWYWKIDFQSWT